MDAANPPGPPNAGHGLLGGQPPRDQCMHPAPRLLAVRVHEPRPLGADEHTAVEAHERGSLGPAARPADGIERLFASTAGG